MADKNKTGEETPEQVEESGSTGLTSVPKEIEPPESEGARQEGPPDGAGPEDPEPGKRHDRSKPKKKHGKPKRVDAREALNRLMEKNQIISGLDKALTEKDKQLKDLNDKWLRSVAEFENYRKRSRKEWELLKQQSKTEVILEILNVVDDFERAFSVAGDADSSEFVHGIRLIYNNLTKVLEKFGVVEIDAHHAPFDPIYHMAISQMESDNVASGTVAEVIQKGYKLDETVIRPAKVIVAK